MKNKTQTSNDISNISSLIQDYLSFMYIMERDQEPIVGSRLAELLGVTPPTVTNTLKRMMRDDLISMDEKGTHLTERGYEAAKVVMRRHMLVEWMMAKTLPWSLLHSEAHQLEHAISAMTETALMDQLRNPETCPHGNPLPGSDEVTMNWIPLLDIPVGETVVIRRVHEIAEENTELLAFLEANKVMPGIQATINETLPFNQTITIIIDTKPVILGFAAARFIYVEKMSETQPPKV